MTGVISTEAIAGRIYSIRGQKVMLDRDLAALYRVATRVLNQAVSRNLERFPGDFMFELSRDEITRISQFVISSKVITTGKAGGLISPIRALLPAPPQGGLLNP